MSSKSVAWILLAAIAIAAILLFNYWAAYQPLSTLVYAGIILALCGFANLLFPFRFLGIRKRLLGVVILACGVGVAFAALHWPVPLTRVAQTRTVLDEVMPEYNCFEKHSLRIHARPEQAMLAIRQSTFSDMKSLGTLLRIRETVLRNQESGGFQLDKRIIDAFAESQYILGGSDHEIAWFGPWNTRTRRRPDVNTLQQFTDYCEPGGVKMGFDFVVEDAGAGWSTVTTETRVLGLDDATRRGLGRYWRLIAPGSGLLRRQWLDGIRRRAENMPNRQPASSTLTQ